MKVCIIDDQFGIRRDFSLHAERLGWEVVCLDQIPENIDDLRQYDALVVDGAGIGNKTYETGGDFLKAYAADPTPGQVLIHFSGFIMKPTRTHLEALGVICIPKYCSVFDLVQRLDVSLALRDTVLSVVKSKEKKDENH